jgi:hypothetical protein
MIDMVVYDTENFTKLTEKKIYIDNPKSDKTFSDGVELLAWEVEKVFPEKAFNRLYKFLNKIVEINGGSVEFLSHATEFEVNTLINFATSLDYDSSVIFDCFYHENVDIQKIAHFIMKVGTLSYTKFDQKMEFHAKVQKTDLKSLCMFYGIDTNLSKSEKQFQLYRELVTSFSFKLSNVSKTPNHNIICPECFAKTFDGKSCWLCKFEV